MHGRSSPARVQAFVSRLLEDEEQEPLGGDDLDRQREAAAKTAFGQDVGLNADWSVSAWFLGPGKANLTDGAYYLIDGEDDGWYIVRRWDEESASYRDEIGQVEVVFKGDFEAVLTKAMEIRERMRQLTPEERSHFRDL